MAAQNALCHHISKYIAVLGFLLFYTATPFAYSQSPPLKEINIQAFIEELFPAQDEDIDYEEVYETLLLLYQNPLNLNKATRNEIQSLFVLSEHQVNSFFAYKDQMGLLLSIYELQAIPGFDRVTIYKLLPFVYVSDPGMQYDPRNLFQRIISEKNNMLIMRWERTMEDKRGYLLADSSDSGQPVNRYQGSPDKLYSRFRVSHPKDFSLGFTVEKDAGEQLIFDNSTSRYGFDYYSYHFQIQNKGKLKNLVIGDYQVQVGQSLLLGAGFIVGKGAETINTIRRNTLGIRPYTSAMETGFFRGAAATFQLKNYNITSFYSNRQQDGNLQFSDSLENELPSFSTIQTSGLHRTPNEINAKNNINEQVTGTNISFKSNSQKLEAGLTFINTFYDARLSRNPTKYNQYEFSGKNNNNVGANFSYSWQNFNFFGEGAISENGGKGAIAGLVSSLSPIVDMSMIYRNYGRDFHSFYGKAFGENTRNINEEGIYMGLKIKPISKLVLNLSYDRFSFPWLKYRVDAPSYGNEFLSRLSYAPSRQLLMYLQYREKDKGLNDPHEKLNLVRQGVQRNYIFNLDYSITKALIVRSRVQASNYSLGNNSSSGFAIAQDLNYSVGRLSFSGRFALFETDDYQTRQYIHEKDVLYAFSIPAYYGRGTRNYIMLRYKLGQNMQLWARYARTFYRDRDEIGSGLERIEGSQKTDLKVQVLVSL